MSNKVLITGAAGFVGSAICSALLEKGYEVTGLTRDVQKLRDTVPGVQALNCDLLTEQVKQISFEEFDVVVHAAGEVINESVMHELHVQATANMLEHVCKNSIHWIQISSVGVYGPVDSGEINTESPHNPKGVYETTKLESDEIVKERASEINMPLTVLQPSNVFSQGMTNDSLRSLIRAIKSKKFFYIGSAKKALVTLVHVDTVAEAVLRSMENKKSIGKTYILSDYISLQDFVGIVHQRYSMSPVVMTVPIPVARALACLSLIVPRFPLTKSRVEALTKSTVYDGSQVVDELGLMYCKLPKKITEMCE